MCSLVIGSVLEDVTATREVETVTFIKGRSEGEELDGVLVEITDDDGRIAEITLLLRPLATLQKAVVRMAGALAEGSKARRIGPRRLGYGAPMALLARLLTVVAIAIVLFDPQVALAQDQKQPTAIGSGGAAATRRPRRHPGRHRDAAPGRERGRRRRGGGRSARRDRAVLVRHRRRRVHGDPHLQGQGHHHRRARGVAAHDAPGLVLGERRSARLQRGVATAACRPASPARPPPGSAPWTATAPGRSAARSQPGIRVASDGFTVDQTFFDQTTPNIDWFNDIPSTAAIYLDPDGTPRDVGSTLQNPDLARTYRLLGREGVDAFYRGELASAMADASQHPPKAADANHAWRPGLMTTDDLRRYRAIERNADPQRLPRPRHLGHGPAVERRLHRRRGAQHPRGLPGPRPPTASARSTSCSSRRASRSPTATPTWRTRTSSTCRSPASCPTASPPSGAR